MATDTIYITGKLTEAVTIDNRDRKGYLTIAKNDWIIARVTSSCKDTPYYNDCEIIAWTNLPKGYRCDTYSVPINIVDTDEAAYVLFRPELPPLEWEEIYAGDIKIEEILGAIASSIKLHTLIKEDGN